MQRFMKNTKTGVIFPYNAESMRLDRKHLVECNAAGVPVGVPESSIDDLHRHITALEAENAALKSERDLLAARLAQAETALRNAETPETKRRLELESMKVDELRDIAATLGIEELAGLKKNAIIDAILAVEFSE